MIPEVLDDVLRQLAQINSDCSSVFNKMEQACAYIKCGLVLDDLVYPPLHSVFLRFVESNMDALNRLTTPDVPYGNVHYVLSKWGKKAKNESIDRRQRELDEERSEILSTLI